MKVCRICDQGNFTNFIYWEIFIDQRVYEALFLYHYICQRDEMSPSQDPPQPLPQRPDGKPGVGGELCSAGERDL